MKKHISLKTIILIICFLSILNNFSFSQTYTTRQEAQKHANIMNPVQNSSSSLRIDSLNNIAQSIINVLFGGCLEIYNLTYTGPHLSIGYFVDESATLGIDSGIIMTTGAITNAPDIQSPVSNFASTDNGMPGDPLLESLIPGFPTHDASIIEFDFIPLADSIIGCEYVFASEEYPEYVCSAYNDIFGFFITGPNPSGTAYNNTNLALIPGTNLPVAINTVNNGGINSYYPLTNCISTSYSSLYIDNEALHGTYWCYDGYTVPFTITCNVIPDTMYHFKIAIADASDGIYDSGVFLKGGSFLGNTPLPIAKFISSIDLHTNIVTFTNQSLHTDRFEWDFGDGTFSTQANPVHFYQNDGIYNVKLISTNTCTSDTSFQVINMNASGIQEINDASLFVSANTIENGLFELSFSNNNSNKAVLLLIVDINGRQLFSESIKPYSPKHILDIRSFANGLYFLKVIEDNNVISLKLLK